jgi:hypothetical protein
MGESPGKLSLDQLVLICIQVDTPSLRWSLSVMKAYLGPSLFCECSDGAYISY